MASHSLAEKLRIHISRIIALIFFVFIFFTSSKWEGISIVSSIFFLVGCGFVGIASLGRLWCSLYIAGYKNNTLVTLGPYSISRNPLYFFSMIGGVGVGLVTETLLIPFGILLLFLIYYPMVIKDEERRLVNLHGDKFTAYYNKTPSFIPNLSRLEEPETYTVNPKIFKRNIFGALWFVWLVGILEVLEELHEANILPTYFTIY
ncbi:methyltransferase family protein [Thermodesulfobacteriota bacterium]